VVLPQEHLITRVRDRCRHDERLAAALVYGSFVTGEADAHSDIEFWLFFARPVDAHEWLSGLGEIRHIVVNEFGAHVAFFPGLIRGEFHVATTDDIPSVSSWPARSAPTDRMLVVDRTGALRRALDALPEQPTLPADIDTLCGRFANWLILAHHVARRGELLRAVDALCHARRHLLWIVRLAEGRTRHWLTPSRNAENDLPADVVRAIHRTTATADPGSVRGAIAAMWACGRGYWESPPTALVEELDAAVA
jgi:lincosamide nucleotidyltransferase